MPILLRLPLGEIILYLSLIGALMEGYATLRRWDHSDIVERLRGGGATAVLAVVALFSFLDGSRIDVFINSLKRQISIQDVTIKRQDARVALAEQRQKRDEVQILADTRANAQAKALLNSASAELAKLRAANARLTIASEATSAEAAHTKAAMLSTQLQVSQVRARVAKVSAHIAYRLHAIQVTTNQISLKAGVYHLKPETQEALVKLLVTTPRRRGSIACVSGTESLCDDFDSVFKNAQWNVLTQRAVSLFSSPLVVDQHGIFVWYKPGEQRFAESFAKVLVAAGLDAVTRENSNDPNPPDLGLTIKYVQP